MSYKTTPLEFFLIACGIIVTFIILVLVLLELGVIYLFFEREITLGLVLVCTVVTTFFVGIIIMISPFEDTPGDEQQIRSDPDFESSDDDDPGEKVFAIITMQVMKRRDIPYLEMDYESLRETIDGLFQVLHSNYVMLTHKPIIKRELFISNVTRLIIRKRG